MARQRVEELIVGLDLGSTAIRMAVGQVLHTEGASGLHILGMIEVPSEGIHKGVITSIEDAVSQMSACLEKVERSVGSPVSHVWVGVNGHHVLTATSRGVVAVSNPHAEITEEDVERAIDAARTVATPMNYEILHVIPRYFTVDDGTPVKDPVSMSGVRLEVDTHIIQGLSGHIKNITRTVYRTGADIDDLVLSVLAASEVVTSDRARDMGCVVIDIGGSTTSMIVIEDGDVVHTAFIPIGSEHITADLAIGLKTSIDVAERVKIFAGTTLTKGLTKRDIVDLGEYGGTEKEEIPRKFIAQIIEARVEELLDKVQTELESIGRSGVLPAGAVFIGGGSKLHGLVDIARRHLQLPASLGYPLNVTSVTDKINDISFVTCVGLVKWGADIMADAPSDRWRRITDGFNATKVVVGSVRKWVKSLLP